jgi:septal ring factor EnvC (AmiA/AmiB activator)
MANEVREMIRSVCSQLDVIAGELDRLDQLKVDVQTEEARLKDLRERRALEEEEFAKQAAAHQREMAVIGKARAEIGVDLKAWQVRISAAEEEARSLQAQNNSLRSQYDQMLASIANLKQRFGSKEVYASEFAARSADTGNQPFLERIAARAA